MQLTNEQLLALIGRQQVQIESLTWQLQEALQKLKANQASPETKEDKNG